MVTRRSRNDPLARSNGARQPYAAARRSSTKDRAPDRSHARAGAWIDEREKSIRSCARPRLGDSRLSETRAVACRSAQCKWTLSRRVGRVRGGRSRRNRLTMHFDDGQHRGDTTQARCAELETQKIVESGRRRSSRRVEPSLSRAARVRVDTVYRRLEGRNLKSAAPPLAPQHGCRLHSSLGFFEQF